MKTVTNWGLFKDVNDRQETMLAYETNYFPAHLMRSRHKIVYSKHLRLTAQEVEERCTEDFTLFLASIKPGQIESRFQVHWEYNNIPTEIEWDKACERNEIISLDLRVSPIIKEASGRVALLSFTRKENLAPHREEERNFK